MKTILKMIKIFQNIKPLILIYMISNILILIKIIINLLKINFYMLMIAITYIIYVILFIMIYLFLIGLFLYLNLIMKDSHLSIFLKFYLLILIILNLLLIKPYIIDLFTYFYLSYNLLYENIESLNIYLMIPQTLISTELKISNKVVIYTKKVTDIVIVKNLNILRKPCYPIHPLVKLYIKYNNEDLVFNLLLTNLHLRSVIENEYRLKLNKVSGIYCCINLINGKLYIGQSIDLWDRFKRHFWGTDHNKTNKLLKRAILKYGIENFKFGVLFMCKPITNQEIKSIGCSPLTILETNICLSYNYKKDLYNSTPDGLDTRMKIGYKLSDETKLKIGLANLGNKHSLEFKTKKSKSMIGPLNYWHGKPLHESTRAGHTKYFYDPIKLYDNGVYIETYNNRSQLAKFFGVPVKSMHRYVERNNYLNRYTFKRTSKKE